MEKWVKENICEQILYLSRTEERKTWFKFNKIDEWKQQTNEKRRRKKTFVLVNLLNEMTKLNHIWMRKSFSFKCEWEKIFSIRKTMWASCFSLVVSEKLQNKKK